MYQDIDVNLKNAVITNNNFNKIGDRIIRFDKVATDSYITIQGNVATNSGDENKEVIKATSITDGVTTNISGNNGNDNEGVVYNEKLRDK